MPKNTPRCEIVELLTARDYRTLREKELSRKSIRALLPLLKRMLDHDGSAPAPNQSLHAIQEASSSQPTTLE